jgi:phenylpropionate dioxygenase-like ring-hydroxylating dioxygenase large terminal subunit
MDLVPNRWYAVLDPREVPAGAPIGRRRFGRSLVFWRDGGGVLRAAEDRCPHRSVALSIGTVEQGQLTCPFHGFRFEGSGACVAVPAHPGQPIAKAMRLQMLPVMEAHELVWLWSGPGEAVGAPSFFDTEGYTWAGSQVQVSWPVHYTRAVENQLDWAHLTFVHRTTIGRFTRAEVDLETSSEGEHFRSKQRGEPAGIHLIGPNVWQLTLSPKLFNFLAFVPVDDEEMVYYMRTYQRIVTVPGLSWLFGKVQSWVNPIILDQDRRVVVTQQPRISALTNGEVYVASDRQIVAYLRWRKQQPQGQPAGE